MTNLTPERLRTPEFWQKLLDLTATSSQMPLDETPVAVDLPAVSAHFWQHGYAVFRGTDHFPQRALAAIANRLHGAGIPAVFLFLDRSAWQAFAPLRLVLQYFLGSSPALLPHLWAWYVTPEVGQTGWPRHRDYEGDSIVRPAGEPQAISLSAWLALSDVDLSNAPLYVEPLSTPDRPVAISGKAGTMAIWRQDLWHFSGAMATTARGPRISLSLEFQNPVFEPSASPLLDPTRPPPWQHRLDLIMAQLRAYKSFENIDPAWLKIADHWQPHCHATFSR